MTKLIQFIKSHLIITNLVVMLAVVTPLLLWGIQLFLNSWTGHGDVRTVPNVVGMNAPYARNVLGGSDLTVEVTDSLYNPGAVPGTIIEQNPPAGNTVKPGRTIYVITNAFNPPEVQLPQLVGTPLRQARATLANLGFKNIGEVRVASEYKDLVIAVKSRGVTLRNGTRLPVTSPITIEVGEGYVAPVDTLDYEIQENYENSEDYGI